MKEIMGVLKPEGWAVLQVSMDTCRKFTAMFDAESIKRYGLVEEDIYCRKSLERGSGR